MMKARFILIWIFISAILSSCGYLPYPTVVPPQETPILVDTPTVSPTPKEEVLATLTSTVQIVGIAATSTPTMIQPQQELELFDIQPGSPIARKSWTHGCDWTGIAGQVFSMDGDPLENVIIETGGNIGDFEVFGLGLTGLNHDYGPGGYEIKLPGLPTDSTDGVWIQLYDGSGKGLSPKIFVDTFESCEQNLVLINFVATDVIPESVILILKNNP